MIWDPENAIAQISTDSFYHPRPSMRVEEERMFAQMELEEVEVVDHCAGISLRVEQE